MRDLQRSIREDCLPIILRDDRSCSDAATSDEYNPVGLLQLHTCACNGNSSNRARDTAF